MAGKPKRRKGAPPVQSAEYLRGAPMFDAADIARLSAVAGLALQPGITADGAAARLNDAFISAVTWGALDERFAPASEIRDYLDRIAAATEQLIATLDICALADLHDPPDASEIHGAPGWRHLTDSLFHASDLHRDHWPVVWLAQQAAPDFHAVESDLRAVIRAAAGGEAPDQDGETRSRARRHVLLALERTLLGLPVLLAVARIGRDRWAAARSARGERADNFRRALMRDLARLYRNCYGRPPVISDAARDRNGPATHWICELAHIAGERADLAPVVAADEMPGIDGAAMVRAMAALKDDTLARYFLDGWNTLPAAERETPGTS